jgi:CubicO group peptidase (beta-lactamase class C family)
MSRSRFPRSPARLNLRAGRRLAGRPLVGLVLLALGVGGHPNALSAQTDPQADPRSDPLSGLDAYVEQALVEWEIPGLALAVVQGDSVRFAGGWGVQRLGRPERVDAHTLFAIGSATKAFTSAALALLVDEGTLAWDRPVERVLPGFAVADPAVTRTLTVRDLLTHRSGLARLDNLWIASPFDRAEIVQRLRHLPQVDGFRRQYGYNNLLYLVAGEVAAAEAGTSWDALLEDRIFGPLGMERTTSRAAEVETRSNTSGSHAPVEGRVREIPRRDYDAIGGAGAIWSSAVEMAHWMRLQLNQGTFEGRRILSAARFEEMWAPETPIQLDSTAQRLHPTNHFLSYGLGWRLQDLDGRRVVQHSGSINYTRTQVTLVPEEGIGIVAFANLSSSNLQLALTYWILDALEGRTPEDWSRAYLELQRRSERAAEEARTGLEESRLPEVGPSLPDSSYRGRYTDDLFGEVEVSVEAGASEGVSTLVLRVSEPYVADLIPWHQEWFRAVWRRPGAGEAFVHFSLDRHGRITGLDLEGFATYRKVEGG